MYAFITDLDSVARIKTQRHVPVPSRDIPVDRLDYLSSILIRQDRLPQDAKPFQSRNNAFAFLRRRRQLAADTAGGQARA